MTQPSSIPGVVHVEERAGPTAAAHRVPDLLVEVPHGADRRAHYDALRQRLVGELPPDLHTFFHVNTDVGAWSLGCRVAERVIAARPSTRVLLLRCLVPRTFVDCNRILGVAQRGDLSAGGVTAAMPPYVRDPADQALLNQLHAQYVAVAEAAYRQVCDAGGFALNPHTYGPRTLAVDQVDDQIVENLRRAHTPDVLAASPLRPEIDLITRTADRTSYAPAGAEDALVTDLRAAGFGVEVSKTYVLLPVTQGYRFATGWPGQVLGFEARRDLLVTAWRPFEEQVIDDAKVDRMAAPLAAWVAGWLDDRPNRG